MTKSSQKGFTLIELLVVIAIIGLLSTLAVVALNSARQKSRDSKRVADVKQIQTALELYFADNNSYPATPTAGASSSSPAGVIGRTGGNAVKLCNTGSGNGWQAAAAVCTTTYMGLAPRAPEPADNSSGNVCTLGTATSVGTNDYNYTGTGTGYSLTFCLGAQVGSLGQGLRTATADGIN